MRPPKITLSGRFINADLRNWAMLVTSLRTPPPLSTRRPVAATAAPSPDIVTLSARPPAQSRSALWTSLAAAGNLTASLTLHPGVAASLTEVQREGLQQVIAESQQAGYRFTRPAAFWEGLLHRSDEVELTSHEVMGKLGQPITLYEPGVGWGVQLETLEHLAALDAIVLKQSEPEVTAHPHEARAMRNLLEAGYEFQYGTLKSFRDMVISGSHAWVHPPGRKDSLFLKRAGLRAEDYYKVSHDERSVPDVEFAQKVGEMATELGVDPTVLYVEATAGEAKLAYRQLVLHVINKPGPEALQLGLERFRARRALVDQHLDALLTRDTVSSSTVEHLLDVLELPDTGLTAHERADALLALGDAELRSSVPCLESLAQDGLQGQDLLTGLEHCAAIARELGWDDVHEAERFLNVPGQGFWQLPYGERQRQYVALARLSRPSEARELLEQKFSQPQPHLPEHLELAKSVLAAGKASSRVRPKSDLAALELVAEPHVALAAYREAFQQGISEGRLESVTAWALARLRGWSGQDCAEASRELIGQGAQPDEDLPALLSGAAQGEPALDATRRYRELLGILRPHSLERSARQVFPVLKGYEGEFSTLLTTLVSLERPDDAGRLFRALRDRAGDRFGEVFPNYVTALLSGTEPEKALETASPSSAIGETGSQVRVGAVVVRKRQDP